MQKAKNITFRMLAAFFRINSPWMIAPLCWQANAKQIVEKHCTSDKDACTASGFPVSIFLSANLVHILMKTVRIANAMAKMAKELTNFSESTRRNHENGIKITIVNNIVTNQRAVKTESSSAPAAEKKEMRKSPASTTYAQRIPKQ